jgi:hypothetical protein
MKFHLFNILIGSVNSQFASFSILNVLLTLYELFMPLSNICFLHNFWALCFRQHCRGFTCTPPSFGKNFKLIICSNYDYSFCNERCQHTRTHTHAHEHFFIALTHLMLQLLHHSLHKGKTRTGELLNSSTNNIHISKKNPTSCLQVHSLRKHTSSKCIQVESISEITPVRIRAVRHTANIHSIVGLAVQGVQRLPYKAQSPQYHIQHILAKMFKNFKMFECSNYQ